MGNDVALTVLGDVAPEPKLGLAPGSFPKSIAAALEMLHPEDRPILEDAIEDARGSRGIFSQVYRLADGQGGWRWIEGRAVPVDVREGKAVGWVFTNRDSTELRESNATLRQTLHELGASRAEVMSEHDRLWKLAANAFSVLGEMRVTKKGMLLEFLGDGPHEEKVGLKPGTLPRTVDELMLMIHPADVKPFQQAVEHMVATGDRLRLAYRLADGYGGWRWLQARAVALEGPHEGKYLRWLHDTIDITERKDSEQALLQSLEELRQLKAQLQNENLFLREEVTRGAVHRDIIGQSAALARVLEQVDLVAVTASTVLIGGETGTGKELVAPRHSPAQQTLREIVCGRQLRRPPGVPRGKRGCSATNAAPSPGPSPAASAASNKPTAAHCSSMKWANCRSKPRQNYCASCSRANLSASAATDRSRPMCASSPPPTVI